MSQPTSPSKTIVPYTQKLINQDSLYSLHRYHLSLSRKFVTLSFLHFLVLATHDHQVTCHRIFVSLTNVDLLVKEDRYFHLVFARNQCDFFQNLLLGFRCKILVWKLFLESQCYVVFPTVR